jgi:Zn-dependent M28 family amino/carboxypeptidase
MAANDGASGVAVMLELARLLQHNDSARVAVDFICFDAEDWGVPQWSNEVDGDSWALGAQYWASNYKGKDYQYGILLDMVGGQGAKFYHEGFSMQYARTIVEKVWQAASAAGYGSIFVNKDGGGVTDDHLPVNEKANIPCIDIINHYPDCQQSSFGPTWHTINDDMQHIDKNTLQAVGQTLVQLIYSE